MDTIFKNNCYRILELFIEQPSKDFSVRGISRKLRISHATVLKYIEDLLELNLIKKKEETLYPTYYAATEDNKYKIYKKNYIVFKIVESKLVDFIQKKQCPLPLSYLEVVQKELSQKAVILTFLLKQKRLN